MISSEGLKGKYISYFRIIFGLVNTINTYSRLNNNFIRRTKSVPSLICIYIADIFKTSTFSNKFLAAK